MRMYQVSWTESKKYFIQVEAENEDEAQREAFKKYDREWDAEPEVEKDSIRVYEF